MPRAPSPPAHPRAAAHPAGRAGRPDRPGGGAGPRSAGEVARRARIVDVAERRALAQGRHFERKIGPAHAGTLDRPDTDDARAFPDSARIEALHLGFTPPRLA